MPTTDWCQSALLASVPPRASAARAKSGAGSCRVPWVSRAAVSTARPARPGGSVSLPASTTSRTLTSGVSRCEPTTTRRPLGSTPVRGVAMCRGSGAVGAGGVVCTADAAASVAAATLDGAVPTWRRRSAGPAASAAVAASQSASASVNESTSAGEGEGASLTLCPAPAREPAINRSASLTADCHWPATRRLPGGSSASRGAC